MKKQRSRPSPGDIDKLALLPLGCNIARATGAPPVAALAAPAGVTGLPTGSATGEMRGSSSTIRGVPVGMGLTALAVVALRPGTPVAFPSEASPLAQVRMNTPIKAVAQP